jgi:hypothetical protein
VKLKEKIGEAFKNESLHQEILGQGRQGKVSQRQVQWPQQRGSLHDDMSSHNSLYSDAQPFSSPKRVPPNERTEQASLSSPSKAQAFKQSGTALKRKLTSEEKATKLMPTHDIEHKTFYCHTKFSKTYFQYIFVGDELIMLMAEWKLV